MDRVRKNDAHETQEGSQRADEHRIESPTESTFDHIQENPEMSLYRATRTPELSEIKNVLECMLMMELLEPHDPNITDDELIARAAKDGRMDLILGDTPELSGRSALHEAVRLGRVDTILRLLESGADPEASTATGRTALHWAADLGDLRAVRALLEAGASPRATTIFGLTPLEYASCNGHQAVFDLLIAYF